MIKKEKIVSYIASFKDGEALKDAAKHSILSAIIGLVFSLLSVQYVDKIVLPALTYLETSSITKFILGFILTYIILRGVNRLKIHKDLRKKANDLTTLTEGAFLTYYKENSNNIEIKEAENELKRKSHNAVSIRILGASGYRTFTSDSSPLFNNINNCTELFVMLLYPKGNGIRKRVESLIRGASEQVTNINLETEIENYVTEIKKSIQMLKHLRCEKPESNIKLGFYNEEPLLKIIIIEHKLIWMQHYQGGKHVRDLPSYFLEKEEAQSGTGLFNALLDIFNRKWKHVENHLYDFENDEIWNPETNQYESFS